MNEKTIRREGKAPILRRKNRKMAFLLWKHLKCFRSHCAGEICIRNNHVLDLCLRKIRLGKSQSYHDVIIFGKLSKCFLSSLKLQICSVVKSFSWCLVWTVGLTVEMNRGFQISPVWGMWTGFECLMPWSASMSCCRSVIRWLSSNVCSLASRKLISCTVWCYRFAF